MSIFNFSFRPAKTLELDEGTIEQMNHLQDLTDEAQQYTEPGKVWPYEKNMDFCDTQRQLHDKGIQPEELDEDGRIRWKFW